MISEVPLHASSPEFEDISDADKENTILDAEVEDYPTFYVEQFLKQIQDVEPLRYSMS